MKHEAVADFYNQIKGKYGDDYESARWMRTPITRSHFRMATEAITDALRGATITRCFEVGPGAGTWTRLLLSIAPQAEYTLLDISETMLGIARKNLAASNSAHIDFIVSDFTAYTPTQRYDFFFSSRAFEYIVDKKAAIEKIATLLPPGGRGVLITKNPRYWADRIFRRNRSALHQNQVSARVLTGLLVQAGFRVQFVRPATVTVPFFKSAFLNDCMYRVLKRGWITWIHGIFTESYLVAFQKP